MAIDIESITEKFLQAGKETMFHDYIAKAKDDPFNPETYEQFLMELDSIELTRQEEIIYTLGMIHAFELIAEQIRNS